jgi:hypothetical protein
MIDIELVASLVAAAARIELLADDDIVGEWELVHELTEACPGQQADMRADCLEAILSGLVASSDIMLGTIVSAAFVPYAGKGGVPGFMDRWRSLGRDPVMGEVGYLVRAGGLPLRVSGTLRSFKDLATRD